MILADPNLKGNNVESPKPRTVLHSCKVTLTVDDKARMADALASLASEQVAAELVLEDAKARAEAVVQSVKKRSAEITSALRAGYESREIECSREPDYQRNVMQLARLDTGEVVHERALTAEERQTELALWAPEQVRWIRLTRTIQYPDEGRVVYNGERFAVADELENAVTIYVDADVELPVPADDFEDALPLRTVPAEGEVWPLKIRLTSEVAGYRVGSDLDVVGVPGEASAESAGVVVCRALNREFEVFREDYEPREAAQEPPVDTKRATCPVCNGRILLTKAGCLRQHGPRDAPCEGSGAQP